MRVYKLLARVVPENAYYKDVLALELRSGKGREGGDMWKMGRVRSLGRWRL